MEHPPVRSRGGARRQSGAARVVNNLGSHRESEPAINPNDYEHLRIAGWGAALAFGQPPLAAQAVSFKVTRRQKLPVAIQARVTVISIATATVR